LLRATVERWAAQTFAACFSAPVSPAFKKRRVLLMSQDWVCTGKAHNP
jgi:hypothetical protein